MKELKHEESKTLFLLLLFGALTQRRENLLQVTISVFMYMKIIIEQVHTINIIDEALAGE